MSGVQKRIPDNSRVSLAEFKQRIDQTAISQLANAGLSSPAVEEIIRTAYREWCFLLDERAHPNAKARKRRIQSLRTAVANVITAFDQLEEETLRANTSLWELKSLGYRKELQRGLKVIDDALDDKSKPGNVTTDLDHLVFLVAKILMKNDIKPKRHGEVFLNILSAVFQMVGEEDSSIKAAVARAWTQNGLRRAFSIQQLIENGVQEIDDNFE